MTALSLAGWLIGFLVAVVLPLLAWRQRSLGRPPSIKTRLVQTLIVGALILIVASAAKIPLAEIGLGTAKPAFLIAASVAGAAILIAIDLASAQLLIKRPELIRRRLRELDAWPEPNRSNPLLLAAFILAAAGYEEIVFRGFAFYLASAAAITPAVALVPLALIFGFQHLAGGLGAVLYASLFGILFSIIYLTTGSLYPAIAAHAAGNAFTLFYTQPRLRRRLAAEIRPAFLF